MGSLLARLGGLWLRGAAPGPERTSPHRGCDPSWRFSHNALQPWLQPVTVQSPSPFCPHTAAVLLCRCAAVPLCCCAAAPARPRQDRVGEGDAVGPAGPLRPPLCPSCCGRAARGRPRPTGLAPQTPTPRTSVLPLWCPRSARRSPACARTLPEGTASWPWQGRDRVAAPTPAAVRGVCRPAGSPGASVGLGC